jgi:glycosyltransferase involved in cell wall biosynthesis
LAAGDVGPAGAAARAARGPDVRLLFAGRIVAEKGVGTLIAALRIAEAAGHPLRIDVIGEGGMRDAVAALAGTLRTVCLRLLDPVPYGAPFLSLLDGYHALVVPSHSDEQPRVLFDAAARAMAALASDTPGHREVVRADETGWFHPPGDAPALAASMARAHADPAALAALGLAARARVAGMTLEAMHLARARALAAVLPQRTIRSSGS